MTYEDALTKSELTALACTSHFLHITRRGLGYLFYSFFSPKDPSIYFRERESECTRVHAYEWMEGQRERENSEADPPLSKEPNSGFDPGTLRS